MMVMSQLTLMAAACAMLMAMPMMTAQMHTLTRDTTTSLLPVACVACQHFNVCSMGDYLCRAPKGRHPRLHPGTSARLRHGPRSKTCFLR